MLNILHLLSNWKWTERAEPAADLALGQIRLGARAVFACGQPPYDVPDAVGQRARKKGLDPLILNLPKHLDALAVCQAWPQLSRVLKERRFDIIHAHMRNAHLLGGVAARRVLPRARVVCTVYEPDGPKPGLRERLLLSRFTDGVVVIAAAARECLARTYRFPEDRIALIEPGLDLARYQSSRSRAAVRADFGLKPSDQVVGMVTRIRAARRLDLVARAIAILAPRHPDLKLMIVGRGGEGAVENVVEKPAVALGIRERIVLAGYCRDEALAAAYKAMDMLAYPCPGTDPSCRTVREALAAGLPVAACATGFLPDLITDGETGFLTASTPEAMAVALERMLADPVRREAMAERAAKAARARFSIVHQAEQCLAFYDKLGSRR